jgi:hypothetical protein
MGPSLEVIKSYERFIRNMEERRTRFAAPGAAQGAPTSLVIALRAAGTPGGPVDIAQIGLTREGAPEDQIELGAPQDDGTQHAAHVVDDGGWSAPQRAERYYRTLQPGRGAEARLPAPGTREGYAVEIVARLPEGVSLTADIDSGGSPVATSTLEAQAPGWATYTIPLGHELREEAGESSTISHWRGSGELGITRVTVLDAEGTARMHHLSGASATVVIEVRANVADTYDVIPAALIFRGDAVVATRHVGEPASLTLEQGGAARFELQLSPLLIGAGHYTVSAGLYRTLSVFDTLHSEIYDYVDRSCDLAVYGLPPLHDEIVIQPAQWSLVESDGPPRTLRELRDVEAQATEHAGSEQDGS